MSVAEARANVLGDFLLGEKLGEGGFGTVYRAEQRSLGRPAVVKVIRASLLAHRDAAERFALEARLASRFDHPYAAHVYAFGVEPGGSMWIAMELVKGTPLDELVQRTGPMPIERFVPLFERLCDVVQAAHEQQIIHRDIKPANVMVVARGGRLLPKLLDFGIAKTLVPERPLAPTLATTSGALAPAPSTASEVALDRTQAASASGDDRTAPVTGTDATQAIATDATAMSEASAPSHGQVSSSLTRVGQILGSPPYMAPEQWLDAGQVGAWTDQYALGLLAYEVLAGRRAYTTTSLEGYRELHASAPLPALPPQLPAALHAVLARATAKRASERFASLGELAAAVREAALGPRSDGEDAYVAPLDAGVRSLWTDEAPAPLAEAIGALATARSAAQASELARSSAALLARYLGILAVACRSKLGSLAAGTPAHASVLASRRRTLQPEEWLALAAEVAQPFAAAPETFPIPELASYFADGRHEPLHELLATTVTVTDDALSRQRTDKLVAALSDVLGSASWIADYELARATARGVEIWTGLASERRGVRAIATRLADGEVVVLDADSAPVARLSPLVEIAAPAAGQRDEVFLFVGPGRAPETARVVAWPRGYEREVATVWPWFAHALLETPGAETGRVDDARAPYPGLAAFTADDRDSFVGREAAVGEVLNRLRDRHLVAVVGPSGVGKSSFLAAGVVPALPGGWHAVVVRPGPAPLAALRTVVERDAAPYRDGPLREVPSTGAELGRAIVAHARLRGGTVVVVVDQAEELFTMGASAAEREELAVALASAAADDHVRVVLSLRDDFLVRADALAAWAGQLARGVYVLRLPTASELERAIAVPARRRGYDFDDPALPADIVAAVVDQPGALPLVAFAAAALWERRDRHFLRLTRAAYDALGGVHGALVRHADEVVERLSASERRLVRLAFQRLLTADGMRALVGRSELVAALGRDGERVVERLLAARLVVSRDDEAGERIEIVHESLATTWPRLAGWRHDDAVVTRIQERLTAAAKHWHERGRPASLLWRGPALDDLRRLESDHLHDATERAFSDESLRSARRARRRKAGALVAAFATLIAGVVGLAWIARTLSTQRAAVVERLAASYEQHGRLASESDDAARGLLYLTESKRLGTARTGSALLLARASAAVEAQDRVIGHSSSQISHAQWTAGGEVIVVGSDGLLRAWRLADGARRDLARDVIDLRATEQTILAVQRGRLAAYAIATGERRWERATAVPMTAVSGAGGVYATIGATVELGSLATGAPLAALPTSGPAFWGDFDPAGQRLAVGLESGGVEVFDVATRTRIAACPAHAATVSRVAFAPDGATLLSASSDMTVRVCDPATGEARHHLHGHRNRIVALRVSPDGTRAVTGGRDGTVFVWDLQRGTAVSSVQVGSSVAVVELSPDGTRVAASGRDGIVRIWDVASGVQVGSLQGHGAMVSGLRYGDGAIVTTSLDGSIRRWDVARAIRTSVASHATPGVVVYELDSRGDRVITAGADGRAVVWDAGTHRVVATLAHARGLRAARLAPDARTAVTLDAAGTATRWSLADARPTTLATETLAIAYLPDGGVVASGRDGRLRWWQPDGTARGELALGFAVHAFAIDPGERWLVASSGLAGPDGTIAVVELATRALATTLAGNRGSVVAVSRDRLAFTRGTALELVELGSWRPLARSVAVPERVRRVWALPDGRWIGSLEGSRLVAWSADGARLVGTLANGNDEIHALATTADGALLLGLGHEGTLRIFETATLDRVLALRGHASYAAQLRIASDGHAWTAGNDGRVIRWRLDRAPRTLADLDALVRCRVPLALAGEIAVPRPLDLDDPACQPATR